MSETDWAPLAEALGALASVCDGAEDRDYRGFSAADVADGHFLAGLPIEEWGDLEARVAHHLARIYQRQLRRSFEIEFEDLPVPPPAEESGGLPIESERAAVTGARKERARRERLARTANARAVFEGGRAVVHLYVPTGLGLDAEVRALPGYEFTNRWGTAYLAARSAKVVVEFCEKHGFKVDPNLRRIEQFEAECKEREAAQRAARAEAFGPNLMRGEDGGLVLRFDGYPGAGVVEIVKDRVPGRRWDQAARVWLIPDSSLTQAVATARALKLRIEDELVEQARAEARRRKANLAASIALTPAGRVVEVPGLAGVLKAHQVAGLEFIASNKRVLVGDKMGLGKTLTSLAAVAQAGTWPAVVVCKTSLRENWRAEIERFFPDLTVFIATGSVPGEVPDGTDIVVIGFDVLREHVAVKQGGGSKKVAGWLPVLTALRPRALIVDESQFGKEATSLRSRAMQELAEQVPPDGLVLCLTGTALLNRPRELVQQLKILGRLEEFGGEKPFLYRYCDPEFNDFGAVFNGASNLEELHTILRESGIYLRRGDEALSLPELTIRPHEVKKTALDAKAMKTYQRAEKDFLTEWITLAQRRGVDLTDEAALMEFCARAMNAEVLVRLNLLRQLIGEAKRPAVIALVAGLVKQQEKVMIAAHHRESVGAYTKAFGKLRIQGGQSPESIEADKAVFQSQPVSKAPVITVSTQAGGVGHTLTAAAHGVMAELPWTWAEIEQMAARLHRIGQDRPVDFPVLLAPGTVDDQMWQTVTRKRWITHSVLDAPDAHDAIEYDEESEHNAAAQVMARMMAEHAKMAKVPAARRARGKKAAV